MSASVNLQQPHCVIVYGVDTQIGLNLVRELGSRDITVVAIGKSANAVGLYSRYAKHKYVLRMDDSDDKIHQLKQIQQETAATHLLCVSETDILLFDQIRHRLGSLLPLVPDTASMQKVLDKRITIDAASELGIATPKSYIIQSEQQLEQLLPELTFPVVIKWSNPHTVTGLAAKLGIQIDKLLYLYNAEELTAKIKQFTPLGQYPLIQQYCAGYGLGQFFFIDKGKDLLRFQHRRINEWPPEGGYSSWCESLPLSQHSALQAQSLRLLQKLNWAGVAMVEYRYDPITDQAVLMEINGRFWGSYPLAYHCNAPFAWMLFQVQGLQQYPSPPPPSQPLQCRNLLVELKRLHRIWFKPELIQDKSRNFNKWWELARVLGGFFNPRMRYYLFSLDDMQPAWRDLRSIVRKSIGR